jgi:hypothetical protein
MRTAGIWRGARLRSASGLGVILMFVGAAAAAGFQAGAALAVPADLDPWTQRGFSICTAFVIGYAGWRDLLSPGRAIERPAFHT